MLISPSRILFLGILFYNYKGITGNLKNGVYIAYYYNILSLCYFMNVDNLSGVYVN